jgi:uncharacterized protein (TIGR04540 family)
MGVKKVEKEKFVILRNPLTAKQLAKQVILAGDAYVSLKLSEKDFRELLYYYANKHGRKVFGITGGLNPTLRRIIGKRRAELVEVMLSGYQLTLF